MRVRMKRALRNTHQVLAGGETYDLPVSVAISLIQNGFAVPVRSSETETTVIDPPEKAIKHCGGPWYEVAGEKYRGKQAAIAAARKLEVEHHGCD